ncbi:MAG: Flp family type IVb pilin [Alphaproteobacteria bacterium]
MLRFHRLLSSGAGLASRPLAALRAIAGDDEGVTAVEYGLIAAAIAVAIVIAVFALGETVEGWFEESSEALESAGG